MNTAWSVYSGGRLNSQMAANASFRIATDDAIDDVLLSSAPLKQSFGNNLRRQLSRLALHNRTLSTLTLVFHSTVVVDESGRRDVEFSVVVMDEVSDSMLWYFMLTSPEEDISPDDLDEITVLIINRLYARRASGTYKACL
jgi:hypothetical protein